MSEANLGSALTNYWMQAGEKIAELYDKGSLRSMCREIADYYVGQANKSAPNRIGTKSKIIDVSLKGCDLIKIGEGIDKKMVVDKDGIFVGLVDGNDYHELKQNRDVECARKFGRLERNLFLRMVNAPKIILYHQLALPIFYGLGEISTEISITSIRVAAMYMLVQGIDASKQHNNGNNVPELEQRIQNSLGAQNEENNE